MLAIISSSSFNTSSIGTTRPAAMSSSLSRIVSTQLTGAFLEAFWVSCRKAWLSSSFLIAIGLHTAFSRFSPAFLAGIHGPLADGHIYIDPHKGRGIMSIFGNFMTAVRGDKKPTPTDVPMGAAEPAYAMPTVKFDQKRVRPSPLPLKRWIAWQRSP
jgi:hypothetical protein